MVIDFLKAIASQIIVLHHLATYGPLSWEVWEAAPSFIDWMYHYGRWAPQVFLVVAGFLLARGYAPNGTWSGGTLWQAIKKRYLRLILPYLVALVLAVLAASVVRPWLPDDTSIPNSPTWDQWVAHLFLMQSITGYDALSAGVWYIAIDFQLFVLMALLLWLGKRFLGNSPRLRYLPLALIGLGMAASLLFFNRDYELDNYAIYFFGAYGMGAVAFLLGQVSPRRAWLGLLAMLLLVAAALMLEFRGRLVLALVVALLLFFQQRLPGLRSYRWHGPVQMLGKISYSLFLVHYPILLLANMICVRCDIHGHGSSTVCAISAWLVSPGVAWCFHRWVEAPCAKLGRTKPTV